MTIGNYSGIAHHNKVFFFLHPIAILRDDILFEKFTRHQYTCIFILCPKISSIHFLLNYSISVNTSWFKLFKRCSLKGMKQISMFPLKHPFSLSGFNTRLKSDVYVDFLLHDNVKKW